MKSSISAALCIAIVIGATCSPIYLAGRSVEARQVGEWIAGISGERFASETKYFEPKDRIIVDSKGGIIYVKGWNKSRIEVRYTKHSSNESLMNTTKVEIRESAEELAVITNSASYPANVDYEIMVPEDIAQVLLKAIGGRITIEGLSKASRIEAESPYGPIIVKGIYAGTAKLSTEYTDIEIDNSSFQNLSAKALYGDIDAKLRKIGNISLETVGHKISLSAPDYRNATLSAITSKGKIEIDDGIPLVVEKASERELIAHVGSPVYTIDIKATDGDIEIEMA